MLDISRKIVLYIIIIFLLITISSYFRPIQLNVLIEPYNKEILPNKIHCDIFFSTASGKELEVTGQESIDQIVTLLNDIKVRRLLNEPISWRPKFKSTYSFSFLSANNEKQTIQILSSQYIRINNTTMYKIIGKPDISKLYELILLDQPNETLDKFYYDMIDKDE